MGDDAARFRGAWLRRVSQSPRPIGNLDRLIGNCYLKGRLRAALFPFSCRTLKLDEFTRRGCRLQNPGHVEGPPLLIPTGRGVLLAARVHHLGPLPLRVIDGMSVCGIKCAATGGW